MKKIAVSLLLFFSITSCSDKKKENIKEYFFPNSNEVEIRAETKNNRLDGKYLEFYRGGKIKKEAWFKQGNKEGKSVTYHENGKISILEYFKEGKLDSVRSLYGVTGKVYKVESYLEGKKNGRWLTQYESGKPFQEFNYLDGEFDGKQTVFYEGGKIKSTAYFHKGRPGKLEEYTESGNLITYSVSIIMKEENKLAFTGEYKYKFKLNKPSKHDKFYMGEMEDGEYLPVGRFPLEKEGDYFVKSFIIPKGAFLMTPFTIIAVTKTASGKELVTSKKINMAINNY